MASTSGFTANGARWCLADRVPFGAGFAAFLLDLDGRVAQWGAAARRLFGRSPEQAVGRELCGLLLGDAYQEAVAWAIAEAAAGRGWASTFPAECASGRICDVMFCWEPLAGTTEVGWVMVTATCVPQPHGADGQTAATFERLALMDEVRTRIGTTLDLSQTARDFMDVTIPRFADFAGIYVLERLLHGEPFPERAPAGSVQVRRLALGLAVLHTDPQDWIDAFPTDEIVTYQASSPFARCMNGGEPVLLGAAEMDPQDIDRIKGVIDEEQVRALEGFSVLAVPLEARGTLLGFVAFTRRSDRCAFDDHEVAVAEGLAAQAGMCIDNARLYGREHRTVQALQDSLAPRGFTIPPGLEIAHRYLPAGGTAQTGGDWYDVIRLSQTRVALVIGDAMGHDAVAAAAMGRMRSVVRALADLDLEPAELLRRLDTVTHDTDPDQCATCIYAVGDLAGRSWVLANAGHVPPILLHPDDTTTLLDPPTGMPIGVGQGTFEATEVKIPDGSTLVLYTDGLVESREQDLGTGITALRAALTRHGAGLEAACDSVTRTLPCRYDDVTLLLARIPPV